MSEPTHDAKGPANTPPEPVRAACREGLSAWGEHGRSLAKSAKRRAENLAAGHPVSANMLGRLRTFFAKHAPGTPASALQQAELLLAGGEAGRAWVEALCRAPAPADAANRPPEPATPTDPTPSPSPAAPVLKGAPTVRRRTITSERRVQRPSPPAAPQPVAPPAAPAKADRAGKAPKRAKMEKSSPHRLDDRPYAAHVYGAPQQPAKQIARSTQDMLKRFLEGGRRP